jgi:hypothetical protein
VALGTFIFGLLGVLLSSSTAFAVRGRRSNGNGMGFEVTAQAVAAALWAAVAAWIAYILFSFGMLPGATEIQTAGNAWVAALVTLIGGWVSLLWTGDEARAVVRRWRS